MFKFRRFGRLLAATTVTSLALSSTAVATAQEEAADTVSISITNFTDFHGWIEADEADPAKPDEKYRLGAANIASLMDHVAEDNDYQVRTSSGDNVGGSAPISAVQKDQPTIDALNLMGLDASAVGNHEFDRGHDDLTDRLATKSNFPILGANVLDASGNPFLDPYVIQEFDGVKVALVGTVTQVTPSKVAPSATEGLTFADPVATANEYATELKESGEADIVIVLQHEDIVSHGGFNEHVDAAFGGDSHQQHLLAEENKAQSLEHGRVLTELELTYDRTANEVVGTEWEQFDYQAFSGLDLSPNAEVANVVSTAATQFEVIGGQVIAETDTSFLRGSNPGGATGSNRGVESTANNMLAESNRQAMDAFLGGDQIDIGLMNAGGVRADLQAGDVTFANALEMQPFGNNLAYATMSGQAIIDALERQWQGPEESRPRLSLGVSENVSYTYNPSAPQGERIIAVYVDGERLDPAADYKVATATFLFEGGDGFINPEDVRDLTDVGYLDVTAFADYLESDNGPTLRKGQSDVGITGLEDLKPGETATLELSSLNYSSEGEPMASTVTVEIAGESFMAEIDNTLTDADNGYGENGRATVEVTVPESATGEQELRITTDAGTDVSVPVTLEGETPGDDNNKPGNGGSSGATGSSIAAVGALLAVAAAIAAATGAAWNIYPAIRAAAAKMGIELPKLDF